MYFSSIAMLILLVYKPLMWFCFIYKVLQSFLMYQNLQLLYDALVNSTYSSSIATFTLMHVCIDVDVIVVCVCLSVCLLQ